MTENTVVDTQSTPSAETPSTETEVNETTSVQTEAAVNGDGKLGPDNLPPELEETRKQLMRDYHSKTQQLREERLRDQRKLEELESHSKTLKQLMEQEWVKKAYEQEKQRRNGPVDVDVSDEEFQLMQSADPRAKDIFKKAVQRMAEAMVSKLTPQLDSARQGLNELKTDREFERVASKYKDFKELNDKKALDPYLENNHDYESAYKQYKYDHEFSTLQADLDKRAQAKAQELLDASRNGAISRGGTTNIKGVPLVEKSGSFEDDFDKMFALAQQGHKDVRLVDKKKG